MPASITCLSRDLGFLHAEVDDSAISIQGLKREANKNLRTLNNEPQDLRLRVEG